MILIVSLAKIVTNLSYQNGSYEGEVDGASLPHGFGVLRLNESTYYGEFKSGEKFGIGQLKTIGSSYFGEFKYDKLNGYCVETFRGGDTFYGLFKSNKATGKGKYEWANNEYFDGSFLNGKREGYGLFYKEDVLKYYGEYENDKRTGKGVIVVDDEHFECEWENGKFVAAKGILQDGVEVSVEVREKIARILEIDQEKETLLTK